MNLKSLEEDMSERSETIKNLRKSLQWGKLTEYLDKVVETTQAEYDDYSGYILGVLKSANKRCFAKAINCLIKAEKLKNADRKKIKNLYRISEPMIKFLGLKYFDENNSNKIDREFYLQARFMLLFQSKKNADAFKCLTTLVNEFGKSQYYFQRSKIYSILKKYKESLSDLNSAIKINSKEHEYYYNRAILKDKLHDDSGAYIDMGSAIDLDKENTEYYYFRAVISYNMQRFKNAIDDLKKAIQLEPKDIKLYQLLANCLQNTERTTEAFSIIEDSIEINGTDASNFYIRGTLYNQTKKYKEAIADFETALKYDNISDKRWTAKIWYQKAWAEFKLGDYKNAQSDISQALKFDDKTLAYYYLGMDIEVFGTKDFCNARGYCNKILQRYPDNRRAIAAQEQILKLKK